jgi:hypothetical protein
MLGGYRMMLQGAPEAVTMKMAGAKGAMFACADFLLPLVTG